MASEDVACAEAVVATVADIETWVYQNEHEGKVNVLRLLQVLDKIRDMAGRVEA